MSKQYIGSQQHWEDSVNADYDRREQEAKDYEKEMNRQMEKQMFEQANNPMKQYTYNKQANKLIEQASMEKPEFNGDYFLHYGPQKRYEQHIASLRQIDCSPQCREVWKDGQVVKESEFEEKPCDCMMGYCRADTENVYGPSCKFAYPIHQEQESEDDVWEDFFTMADDLNIAELKQHFSITRKIK